MKKIVIVILALLCGTALFAQNINYMADFDDNGSHVYETVMSDLYRRKMIEKVRIQNNSSFKLEGVKCEIEIFDKTHTLKLINSIVPGATDNFDGYEDDEMKDEFPAYFGKFGKFSKDNYWTVIFKIDFGQNNSNVRINKIYSEDKDLCFAVVDAPDAKVTKQVTEDEVKVIVIDGKKFMLIGDNVFEIK